MWKERKYPNHNICFYWVSSVFFSDKATWLSLLRLQANTDMKNELDTILLNQLSGWLVWLFSAQDRCIASGRNNTWFFRSCCSFFAGSWEKDLCYTTKLCALKVSSLKISEEEQAVSFSVLECFLEVKGVYRIFF